MKKLLLIGVLLLTTLTAAFGRSGVSYSRSYSSPAAPNPFSSTYRSSSQPSFRAPNPFRQPYSSPSLRVIPRSYSSNGITRSYNGGNYSGYRSRGFGYNGRYVSPPVVIHHYGGYGYSGGYGYGYNPAYPDNPYGGGYPNRGIDLGGTLIILIVFGFIGFIAYKLLK